MNPILIALDVDDLDTAVAMAEDLSPFVGGFKVGLELLAAAGPRAVSTIADLGMPVFCDAKLHDIPNTVEGAARGYAAAGARWITVHAGGGVPMMEAAVTGAREASTDTGILAVTVLTSIDDSMAAALGVAGTTGAQVARLTALARDAGVEGVVCSVADLSVVADVAPDLVRVTPGIRPSGTDVDDQRRVATPERAVAEGADLIVVARAVTASADPVGAAAAIAEIVAPEGVGR